ncbi:type II toxin-antitoxin system RelE/ParE family toxin [Pedobacter sp. PWIIR3]
MKIHADALDDIQNATDWYNKQSKGLGKRFQKQVIQQINKLKSTAQLYAIRYEDVRCMVIKKFPFMVHYSLNIHSDTITVFAVFHTSLNPKIWDKRD